MLKQNFLVILGTKWVEIRKVANYKVANLFEYYDFDLSHFSIQGHLKQIKMLKFKLRALNGFK